MDCIDFDTISLIEGEVITDFINSNANIRRLRTVMEYTERDISEAQEKITELGKKIIWRDGFIPFEIVRKESNVKDDSVPTVEPMLSEIYIEYIKKELDKFRKNYKHEQYKKTKPRSYYTIGKTKADNLREAPGANKLSS
jgi:hypothetical protein